MAISHKTIFSKKTIKIHKLFFPWKDKSRQNLVHLSSRSYKLLGETTELYRINRERHIYICNEAVKQQLFCCIRPAVYWDYLDTLDNMKYGTKHNTNLASHPSDEYINL